MPSTRKRRTVRIRRFPKRRVYSLPIEVFLALFEPVTEDN